MKIEVEWVNASNGQIPRGAEKLVAHSRSHFPGGKYIVSRSEGFKSYRPPFVRKELKIPVTKS